MKTSRRNKRARIRKARIRFGIIVLVTIFLMIFLIGKIHSIHEEGVLQEAIKQEAIQQEAIKQEAIQQEAIKQEAVKQEAIKQDAIKQKAKQQKKSDGKPKGKVVYLTFDDGPSKLTDQFLDVLKEQNVKATFFMQGSNLKKTNLQESVKRVIREGHYIGGHSMSHDYQKLYTNKQFVPEMNETLALIHDITGTNPRLVRAPYGSAPGLRSERIRNQIVESGIKLWDWTIDSNDWRLKGHRNQILENIKRETKADVEVVLMHEKSQTLQELTEIITFYRDKGYAFGVYNDDNHFVLNFQNDERL
ncbi:polysaccharide deacetylase family protein [Paenibacillus macquariensis]|uniref:Peptidoglycan/xylan/chitin deacetylase, PgdA/CDA1 family n=1 Tax=Paenibacillus macquariensis TaxID=948756 RepID=A0ABY1KFC4_9BACL|nr:polysaccharide deacetylase family protein [Paenibacillus macquariensis]SIR75442.1 Peptidoglycan/xylan/chitin deacetylase, PgdA/CDA1 family [Paenibacillus macquariensis]